MRNILKKIAVIIVAAMIIVPATTFDAHASSSVSVTGGDNVKGGEVFTVTITFDGDDIGRVVGDITYDTDMLSYISGGSSTGNVGYVELRNAGTGEPLRFELEFQALKEGETVLTVAASEMYDLGEGYMDTPSATKTVTISGDADEEEIIEETTEPDNAPEDNLSIDEKEDMSNAGSDSLSDSGALAKYIMYGIGALVVLLIIVLIFRRRR